MTMEAIPPNILWGENIWHPEHPLSDRLIDHLFNYTLLHNGFDGTITSESKPYCDFSDDTHDSDGWPPNQNDIT